jgi:hypothetical protein
MNHTNKFGSRRQLTSRKLITDPSGTKKDNLESRRPSEHSGTKEGNPPETPFGKWSLSRSNSKEGEGDMFSAKILKTSDSIATNKSNKSSPTDFKLAQNV